jgi:DNA repair exonuclease SbcCD ATPase subunit
MNYQKNLGLAPIALVTAGSAAIRELAPRIKPIIDKARNIVSKVGPLVQNIFASKARKEALAQKAQYDQANRELRADISTLDSTMSQLKAQGDQISAEMQRAGITALSGYDGLGNIFKKIIDRVTGTTKAVNQLNSAKQQFEALSKERDQKLSAIDEMLQQLDQLQKRLEDAISENKGGSVMWLGLAALVGIGIYAAKKK